MPGKYLILSETPPETVKKIAKKTKNILKELLGRELTAEEEKKVERKVIKGDPWQSNKYYLKMQVKK